MPGCIATHVRLDDLGAAFAVRACVSAVVRQVRGLRLRGQPGRGHTCWGRSASARRWDKAQRCRRRKGGRGRGAGWLGHVSGYLSASVHDGDTHMGR